MNNKKKVGVVIFDDDFEDHDQLKSSLEDLGYSLMEFNAGFLFVKKGNLLVKIPYGDICHISVDGKYCDITSDDGKKYTLQLPLKEVLKRFPSNFFQVHRNHAINLNRIVSIDVKDNNVLLSNDAIFPISKRQKERLLERINRI